MPTSSEADRPTTGQEGDHSWPDTLASTGVIAAGPDLDIIPSPRTGDGTSPTEVHSVGFESAARPGLEPSARPGLEPSARPGLEPSARPGPGHDRWDDAGPPAGLLAARRLVRSLVAEPDHRAIAGHAIELAEPKIWLWRRLVGACFAYILVSFLWYLVKLPSGLVSDVTLPSQVQVAAAFHELRRDGLVGASLSAHLTATMVRFVAGLGIGSAVGIAVGLAGGSSPLVRTVADPVMSLFRVVPAVAVGPLVILWFGAGQAGLIAAVAFAVMWTAASSTSDWRSAMFRADRVRLETEPGPAPGRGLSVEVLGAGARAAVLVAWTSVVSIETIVADTGLGPMVWFAQGRSDLIAAGLVVIGLIGLMMDTGLRTIQYLIVNHLTVTAQR